MCKKEGGGGVGGGGGGGWSYKGQLVNYVMF